MFRVSYDAPIQELCIFVLHTLKVCAIGTIVAQNALTRVAALNRICRPRLERTTVCLKTFNCYIFSLSFYILFKKNHYSKIQVDSKFFGICLVASNSTISFTTIFPTKWFPASCWM